MRKFLKNNKYSVISFFVLVIFCLLGYIGFKKGLFDSIESFRKFVLSLGPWALVMFFIANIGSVMIPVIPGGMIMAFSVLTFGLLKGFIYNYISICIGSLANFLIARTLGESVILKIFGEHKYNKYKGKIKDKKYEKFLAISFLVPVAPDNFLCYLSGLSNLTFTRFAGIVFIFKPLAIFIYSMAWYYGFGLLVKKGK